MPFKRLNARWNAGGSEYPNWYATSPMEIREWFREVHGHSEAGWRRVDDRLPDFQWGFFVEDAGECRGKPLMGASRRERQLQILRLAALAQDDRR
jgi:hypothetical protein